MVYRSNILVKTLSGKDVLSQAAWIKVRVSYMAVRYCEREVLVAITTKI